MISTWRLYLLRATYLLISLFLTTQIWPTLFHHRPWPLMHGVAVSLMAAMAPLMILGIRSPLKMLPIMLFELFWKTIWIVALALPAWRAHTIDPNMMQSVKDIGLGVILCPIVIPWDYVWTNYLKAPGDPWKRAESGSPTASPIKA
jgi:hypothetical protein